jgi:hypothetical protein
VCESTDSVPYRIRDSSDSSSLSMCLTLWTKVSKYGLAVLLPLLIAAKEHVHVDVWHTTIDIRGENDRLRNTRALILKYICQRKGGERAGNWILVVTRGKVI